jgi:hypothetical protein
MAVSDWLTVGRIMFRHVAVFGLWLSATWPSHGLPRGTIILVIGSKLYGVCGI